MTSIPSDAVKSGFPWRTAALTSLALGVLYALTLPRAHLISDTYEWMIAIDSGIPYFLFHPHHLMYNPLAWAWLRTWQWLGAGDIATVQAMSVAAGMAGAALFFSILWETARDRWFAVAGTLVWATAFASWLFAVEVEVYLFATVPLLAAFRLLLAAVGAPSRRRFFAVGLLVGAGGLFHQTACLFLVPAVAGALWAPGTKRDRLCRALLPVVGFALLAGVPYLLVGSIVFNIRTVSHLLAWMTKHAQYGYYGGFDIYTPVKAVVGIGRAFIYGGAVVNQMRDPTVAFGFTHAVALVAAACAAGGLAACVAGGLRHCAGLRRTHPRAVPLAALWLLANGLFSSYYEAQNVEWWCIPLPPLLLLLLWGARVAWPDRHRQAMAGIAACLLVANGAGDFLPRRNPDFDPFARAASIMVREAGAEGLIVAPALVRSRSGTPVFSLHIVIREEGDDVARALRRLHDHAQKVLSAGHPVVLLEEPMRPESFRYQPFARDAARALRDLTRAHARLVGSAHLPWEETARFGAFALFREIPVRRLDPATPGARRWLEGVAALAARSRSPAHAGTEGGPDAHE